MAEDLERDGVDAGGDPRQDAPSFPDGGLGGRPAVLAIEADDQIAELVDDAVRAQQHQHSRVHLLEDRGAVDLSARREPAPLVDGGLDVAVAVEVVSREPSRARRPRSRSPSRAPQERP